MRCRRPPALLMFPRRAVLLATVCVVAGLSQTGARADAAPTCTATTALVRTLPMCRYGAPVVVGHTLFVPKACRLTVGGKTIARHAVELRDARSGRKLGQASLPAKPTAQKTPPAVGALIGGPYPLYVWRGGIAAIDAASKRARVVFEPTGAVAGVARLGEVLSIVDRLPAAKASPSGALEWTVLDFGAGELLGQLLLRPTALLDVGLITRSGGLTGWLGLAARNGPADLVSVIRGADGKAKAVKGRLQAHGAARGQLHMTGASNITASQKKAPVAGSCPVLTGRDAVLPAAVWVDVRSNGGHGPAGAARTWPIPDCLAATPASGAGLVWAWVRTKAGALSLRSYQCGAAKAVRAPVGKTGHGKK